MKIFSTIFLQITLYSFSCLAYDLEIDPEKVKVHRDRGQLLGINIAVYNREHYFDRQVQEHLNQLRIGLVRMPGGSVSDRFYWNGNGVVNSKKQVDQKRFSEGYWNIDHDAYRPGFLIDTHNWSRALPKHLHFDVKSMHEVTRRHPISRNMVTVNAGTGTAEMAAEWVKWANKTNDFGVTHWEIGNELNGHWEAGHVMLNGKKITAEIYADRYIEFAKAMKAVDPSIKVGGPACDITHADWNSTLLRKAADWVDFISVHSYSSRNSLQAEEDLYQKPREVEEMVALLEQQIAENAPHRKGEIEFSVSEWNSKLPQDHHSYTIFNGLWFSAYIGELFRCGVHSATMWDSFSHEPKGGHGMFYRDGDQHVPTARYWAFWMWSQHMGNHLLKTKASEDPAVYHYATRDDQSIQLMIVNTHAHKELPLKVNIGDDQLRAHAKVELSNASIFFNPHRQSYDWNQKPHEAPLSPSACINIKPKSVTVLKYKLPANNVSRQLSIALPKTWPSDLSLKGWCRVLDKHGSPHQHVTTHAHLQASNGDLSDHRIPLSGGSGEFNWKVSSPGVHTLRATVGKQRVQHKVKFQSVRLRPTSLWRAKPNQALPSLNSDYNISTSQGGAITVSFDQEKISNNKNLLKWNAIPKDFDKASIGGVHLKLKSDPNFSCKDPKAEIMVALQSDGAYWISTTSIPLSQLSKRETSFELEISDKRYLPLMHKTFAFVLVIKSSQPLNGKLCFTDIGLLKRELF